MEYNENKLPSKSHSCPYQKMSHISIPQKHSNTKSTGRIIHVVFLITSLTLNDIGQG